jgi:ornithine cyclodeaminase
MVYVVTEGELQRVVKLDESVVEAVEKGFSELDRGNATVPPIMMIPVPEKTGEVDVKSAYIKGVDRLAIKVASGFFENNKIGLPSASGQMLVLSAETGYLLAVLLDNGYLTQVRTGAAGAIAAKHLASKNAENAGVIGSGTQARFQMRGLALMRNIKTIRMFSLDPDEVKDAYVKDMEAELGVEVIKAESAEEVVRESSVVVTTTPAREGYLKAEWLHPGLHITAMGSDTEEKQELEAQVLGKADLLACDLKSQVFRLGETRSAIERGVLTEDSPMVELGALVNGKAKGRTSEEQITVCDLTGVGVQDMMIAIRAFDLAKAGDMGAQIET